VDDRDVRVEHILYGIASLGHGGLFFDALPPGSIGERIRIKILSGPSASIAAAGSLVTGILITITVTAGTTETQLVDAINDDLAASLLITAVQGSGDGTAVVAPLTEAPLVATGGLIQALIAEFDLAGWDDRDLKTSAEMQALLWPGMIEPQRVPPVGWQTFVLSGQAGLAITNKEPFPHQNAQLLQLGWRIWKVVRQFKATNLTSIFPLRIAFTNTMRDESAGQTKPLTSAVLRVLITFRMDFRQDAEFDRKLNPEIVGVDFGIWDQPLEEEFGDPGRSLIATLEYDHQTGNVDAVIPEE